MTNSILLDTNVLVHTIDADSPRHPECLQVIQRTATGHVPGVLVPQVIIECYSVITSVRRFPRPILPEEARGVLWSLSRAIEVKPVLDSMLDDLDTVLTRSPRRGQDVFDLALVAQMIGHGIRTICTCDANDFDLPGIRAVDPVQLLAVYT